MQSSEISALASGATSLRSATLGPVLRRGEPGYDETRLGGGTTSVEDRYPELIVCPDAAGDVSAALEHARSNSMAVSVRSGGHDVLGASTGAGGMMIDLARLTNVVVDRDRGIAIVGGGARTGRLVEAASVHCLDPVVGMSGNVGLAGLTLGGGMGWTSGVHGAVVDHLLAAEVVTADGQVLRADENQNADLFWALRGGGGNFGVVTEFTYRLQQSAAMLAGTITFQADPRDTLEFLRHFLQSSGDELDSVLFVTPGSKPVFTLMFCWSGDEDAGREAITPWVTFAPPLDQTVGVQSLRDLLGNRPTTFGRQFGRTGTMDALDDAAIDAFVEVLAEDAPPDCSILLDHYMHGALCRADKAASPFIRTVGKMTFASSTSWVSGPGAPETIDWVEQSAAALRPIHAHQEYINYISHNATDVVRNAYGDHYDRLVEVKRRYDPTNVFQGNRNVAP